MSDEVVMEHPALGSDRRQRVTRKQFESAWKLNGWIEVEEEDSQNLEYSGYTDSLDPSEEE